MIMARRKKGIQKVFLSGTIHNQINNLGREAKFTKSLPQEAPINSIISFFKINFKHDKTSLTYLLVHMVDNLLGNNSIITCTPFW